MTTIKSYTDLEQSKKLLALGLNPESADMFYEAIYRLDIPDKIGGYDKYPRAYSILKEVELANLRGHLSLKSKTYKIKDVGIPCWSVGALLESMPQINEWYTPYGHKNDKLFQFEPKICKTWKHSIIPNYKVTYGYELSTDIYDNPVDACVALIEKLHKLKKL